ncbi:four helix bundle protein [Nostoc sp. FACHB-87]|uniref:four helix bundle protein n=1 Tax=Nostocales TaxID=1161 RepID=UPI0016891C88|nr:MULTISPECIES: four helix bundle protein [Nostocales]MBD2299125.1 four helix bundle protein [Nostoc sp. FACHB-190]MBD2456813.1 four helix bundle protein [Nostoc sp. FACHB-87]MBD2476418.1 four helix bundle protein [Anabaena sp. FACHB-83]MBD2488361.1 four helix bundle protein [Aulosira sp. FACHB-615]
MASGEIRSYQDLKVWQEGMNLAEACYEFTKGLPKEEIYGMISQIRRSSASIPANIAEGYGREYRTEYIHFLRTAQGSLKELETHLLLSARDKVGLTNSQTVTPILKQCESVGKLLRALIRSLQNKGHRE